MKQLLKLRPEYKMIFLNIKKMYMLLFKNLKHKIYLKIYVHTIINKIKKTNNYLIHWIHVIINQKYFQ